MPRPSRWWRASSGWAVDWGFLVGSPRIIRTTDEAYSTRTRCSTRRALRPYSVNDRTTLEPGRHSETGQDPLFKALGFVQSAPTVESVAAPGAADVERTALALALAFKTSATTKRLDTFTDSSDVAGPRSRLTVRQQRVARFSPTAKAAE